MNDNKQAAHDFFDRMMTGDIDAVLALFAADATFWAPSLRQSLSMQDFANSLRWVRSRLLKPMSYEVGALTAEDNRVSVLAESFATTIEGRKYNNVYNFHFEFTDGLISTAREYCDTAHIHLTLRNTDPV